MDADVVVVGAGPSGSSTAYHLAKAGLDVVVLEKATFPREKVCGDGLTPRAVTQLLAMGIDISEQAGWVRNKGLRIIGGGMRLEFAWPELTSHPPYGLIRQRQDFDEILATNAAKAGAQIRFATTVTEPIVERGRVTGVRTKRRGQSAEEVRAPLVVAADGTSARLGLATGVKRLEKRHVAVAVRSYYTSPRHDDDYLETYLELYDESNHHRLLPGYGWIFPMHDGTANVGLGILNTNAVTNSPDYRKVMRDWMASLPQEWGLTDDNATCPIRGASLPMGFNRKPHYADGLLLVGDAAGMVNPFNGEGIAYAMESAALAAELIVQANGRSSEAGRDAVLARYPQVLKDTYGGYYTLANAFITAIGRPRLYDLVIRKAMPQQRAMRSAFKLLSNLTDPRDGDRADRVINALTRLAPDA